MANRKSGREEQSRVKWYFLSFRDPKKNRNLGCCNVGVEGGLMKALEKARELKINPGGEVMASRIGKSELEPDRLYSRKEMLNLGYEFY